VGIAGSCRTGDHVVLAGQVGLKDHVTLGDRVVIAAQSGVMDDLDGDEVYFGSPAVPLKEQMQVLAIQRRLPETRRALKKLQRDVADMEARLDDSVSETDSSTKQKRAA
jgi:UDP-3-O-[3-hydroxymyristoyl] glucosamine N-acyltransferase